MARCESCPVREGACRAEADPAYRVFCSMAAGGEASQLAAIRAAAPGAPPPPLTPAEDPVRAVVESPAAPSLALALAVQDCPHRSLDPACGCPGMARCSRFGKDVGVGECEGCLESEGL